MAHLKLRVKFIIFIICYLISARLAVECTLNVTVTSERKLNNCVRKLFRTENEKRTLYYYENEEYFRIQTKQYVSFFNFNNVSYIQRIFRFEFYIMAISTIRALEELMPVLLNRKYFTPETYAIVIFHGARNQLPKVFETLWSIHLMNAVVIEKNTFDMWTYMPISTGKCTNLTPVFLTNCDDFQPTQVAVFNESRSKKFTGCKFRMLGFPVVPYVFQGPFETNTGFEVVILREVVKYLDLDYEFVPNKFTEWGTQLPNGTFTDLYQELHTHRVDIIFGMMGIFFDYQTTFDYIYPHTLSEISFYVPRPQPIDTFTNLLNIFTLPLWLTIVASLLLVAVTWWSLKAPHALLTVFGLSIAVMPQLRYKPIKLKLLYIAWTFTVLILTASYQSLLMTFLFKPIFEKDINSLEELVANGMDLGGHPGSKIMFSGKRSVDRAIHRKWTDCFITNNECFYRLLIAKDFALWRNVRNVNYVMSRNLSFGAHRLPEYPLIPCTMYLQRGSPFRGKVSQIVQRLNTNGLIAKWDQYQKVASHPIDVHAKPIGVKQIKGALLIYGIGILTAFCVFVLELLYNHWKQEPLPYLH